jgi:hypothetical protein
MSLLRPACTITVEGNAYTSAEAALRALEVELDLGDGHDLMVLHCSHLSPLRDAQPDTACTLSLGYNDIEEEVFTGLIDRVEHDLTGVSIEVLAATLPLSFRYGAQTYQDQTVADIIADLAGQAGVTTGTLDADTKVTIWQVNEQRSAWWHINRLARLGDHELFCDPQGALNIRPAGSGGLSHTLRFGAEILAMKAADRRDGGGRWLYAPAGAGSELGSDKWHIILREAVSESPQGPTCIDGALRDRDTAETVTTGAEARRTRSLFNGSVLIMGNSAIRPGDTVDLTDLPHLDSVTGRVLCVYHRFDGQHGFTSQLSLGGNP